MGSANERRHYKVTSSLIGWEKSKDRASISSGKVTPQQGLKNNWFNPGVQWVKKRKGMLVDSYYKDNQDCLIFIMGIPILKRCWNGLLGPKCNIKMSSYQYRKSHCRDKMIIRSSYLHNDIFYTGKMESSYWTNTLFSTGFACSLFRTKPLLNQYKLMVRLGINFNENWNLIQILDSS